MAKADPVPFLNSLALKLAPLGDFRARRMFSGRGLYLDGVIFGLLLRGILWLRVDDRSRPDFKKEGSEPFSYSRPGKTVVVGSYFRCPDPVLADAAKLRRWCKEARRASVERKPQAKSRPRPRPRKAKVI